MPQLDVQVAVAKVAKYATNESGDTLEMIERPQGGLSVVLADGQRSGKAAKSISNIVVRKAISLLAEGVRDGAVARATHDYLRTIRRGKVSATLNIVSVDLETETIVISRNSHCPTVVFQGGEMMLLDEPSEALGIHSWTKPVIAELPIVPNMYIIVFTDGVLYAGCRHGQCVNVVEWLGESRPGRSLMAQEQVEAQFVADAILAKAVDCDQGRPRDDISVMVVAVRPLASDQDEVRRMSARFPIRLKGVIQNGG
jgi:serine phosphatase RsbU (regulator of sigma subunit)